MYDSVSSKHIAIMKHRILKFIHNISFYNIFMFAAIAQIIMLIERVVHRLSWWYVFLPSLAFLSLILFFVFVVLFAVTYHWLIPVIRTHISKNKI